MKKLLGFLKENPQFFYFALFFGIFLGYFGTELLVHERTAVACALDAKIPFVPAFAVPYYLWYAYVPLCLLLVCFGEKASFKRQALCFFCGAFFCELILILFPTEIDFRPTETGGGFFGWALDQLYKMDQPVNVFPSLHCYEAVAAHVTCFATDRWKKNIPLRIGSAVICISICLSTVFVKQHSVLDLVAGVAVGLASGAVFRLWYRQKKEN